MRKNAALVFILILTLSSLIMVAASSAIPKPSVPEFTLTYVVQSYDVPPTYGVDPYTGENVTIQSGYHLENRSIEVSIINQPFSPYNDANGNYIRLYYNVSYKGHYANNWNYYPNWRGWYPASSSEFTVIDFSSGGNNMSSYTSSSNAEVGTTLSSGVELDFRVQAIIGNVTIIDRGRIQFGELYDYILIGESSDWSSTQTLTIGESQTPSSSPATTPTPTPIQEYQQTELMIIGVVIVTIVVGAGIGLLIYIVRRK